MKVGWAYCKNSSFRLNALLLIVFALLSCNRGQEQGTQSEGLAEENTDCVYCGMPTPLFPKWSARVAREGSPTLHYCSPRCLFIHRASFQDQYQKMTECKVTDYYTVRKIDALEAYYVTGSTVIGPMGPDLIPFSTKDDAEAFAADHQGKRILTFAEVDLKVIEEIVNELP